MIRKAPPLDDYVIETLLPDLVGHDHAPSTFLIFIKLWHAGGGPEGRGATISLQTLAVETGLSKSSVQAAIRRLKRRGYLAVMRTAPTAIPHYRVRAPWRG